MNLQWLRTGCLVLLLSNDFLKGKILMHSQKTDLDLFTIKQLNEVSTGEYMCCRSNNATASVTAEQKNTDPLNATQSRTSLHLSLLNLSYRLVVQVKYIMGVQDDAVWTHSLSWGFKRRVMVDWKVRKRMSNSMGITDVWRRFYTLILNLKTLHCFTISSTVQTQRGDWTEPFNRAFERIPDLNLGFEAFKVV